MRHLLNTNSRDKNSVGCFDPPQAEKSNITRAGLNPICDFSFNKLSDCAQNGGGYVAGKLSGFPTTGKHFKTGFNRIGDFASFRLNHALIAVNINLTFLKSSEQAGYRPNAARPDG